jgi:hypothetical protein
MHNPHDIEKVARRLAQDLVEMHEATALELEFWGNALELVSQFYKIKFHFTLKEDK